MLGVSFFWKFLLRFGWYVLAARESRLLWREWRSCCIYTYRKLQARQAFAMYLQRVQQRLMHETRYEFNPRKHLFLTENIIFAPFCNYRHVFRGVACPCGLRRQICRRELPDSRFQVFHSIGLFLGSLEFISSASPFVVDCFWTNFIEFSLI